MVAQRQHRLKTGEQAREFLALFPNAATATDETGFQAGRRCGWPSRRRGSPGRRADTERVAEKRSRFRSSRCRRAVAPSRLWTSSMSNRRTPTARISRTASASRRSLRPWRPTGVPSAIKSSRYNRRDVASAGMKLPSTGMISCSPFAAVRGGWGPMKFLGDHRLAVIGGANDQQIARSDLAGLVGQEGLELRQRLVGACIPDPVLDAETRQAFGPGQTDKRLDFRTQMREVYHDSMSSNGARGQRRSRRSPAAVAVTHGALGAGPVAGTAARRVRLRRAVRVSVSASRSIARISSMAANQTRLVNNSLPLLAQVLACQVVLPQGDRRPGSMPIRHFEIGVLIPVEHEDARQVRGSRRISNEPGDSRR